MSGNGLSERSGGLRNDDGVPGLLLRFVKDGLILSRGLADDWVGLCGSLCFTGMFFAVGNGAYGVALDVSRSEVKGVLVFVSLSKDVL